MERAPRAVSRSDTIPCAPFNTIEPRDHALFVVEGVDGRSPKPRGVSNGQPWNATRIWGRGAPGTFILPTVPAGTNIVKPTNPRHGQRRCTPSWHTWALNTAVRGSRSFHVAMGCALREVSLSHAAAASSLSLSPRCRLPYLSADRPVNQNCHPCRDYRAPS